MIQGARNSHKGRTDPPGSGHGDLELSYEVMELSADTGLRLAIFTAEPGSRSEQALNLLASWAATPDHAVTTANREPPSRPG
jgi:hypothetical protein